jgi:ubiquinone/menaquinone biosynthesis C-methylase UbiE
MIYIIETQQSRICMSNIDSEQYKEDQRQGWNNVANGWRKWWKITEAAGENINRRLIQLAEIKLGSTVLDIASGIGEPSITAANQVGNSGHVLSIDISSQMLSIAKQRAISLGLQQIIEFREGDIETVDLPASTFNAALCRFGLMFLPNVKAGLSSIYRSLVDNGHFATAVWASPDRVPFITLALNSAIRETNSQLPPPGTPGPFSLSDENILRDSFNSSGFKDVTVQKTHMTFEFDSAEVYTSFVFETAAPLQIMLANQAPEIRKKILKAVTESVGKYTDKDTGKVRLDNEVICIVGKKSNN